MVIPSAPYKYESCPEENGVKQQIIIGSVLIISGSGKATKLGLCGLPANISIFWIK